MKFSLISSKGRRETERGSSALGKGLVACLLLMSVSCMLFVGTTMSWFTDQKTGTAGVITAGEFDVTLHIGEREESASEITMTRVGSSNNLWEPGAVFKSPVMYVENTGTLDLEYRLDLLTARDTAANSGSNGITGNDTNLLDVIEFRIVDVATANSLIVNGAVSDAVVNSIFAANKPIDQRTIFNGTDSTIVDEANGVLKLAAEAESDGFIVVGRMKKEASDAYKNMSLTAPFTLVVTAQQSGFTWTNERPIVCTEALHNDWADDAKPFVDDEHGFWKLNESGEHVYYCEVCETALKTCTANEVSNAHAALATAINAGRTPDGVWTSTAADGTVYYYCRVCNTRIDTENGTT